MDKYGTAIWTGRPQGRAAATVSTESGALTEAALRVSPPGSRAVKGTNPEELIAAAHASCFAMALSNILGEAGHTAERMDSKATVTLDHVEGGFAITRSHLVLTATVPGIDAATFAELADKAKAGCPVSKLLRAEISLDAKLA